MASPAPKRPGPRTARGRAVSSSNSTTHGLRANGLLLPGEDAELYVAELSALLESMAPQGAAEARVVATIADLLWRQRRWSRAVDAATKEDLEARVKMTPEFADAARVQNAIVALSAMLDVIEGCSDVDPAQTQPLVNGARGTLSIIEDVVAPGSMAVAVFRLAVDALDKADNVVAVADAIIALRRAGTEVRRVLVGTAEKAELAVRKVELTLSSSALPAGEDAKKLVRYGRMIDSTLEAQLRILGGLRDQRRLAEQHAKATPDSLGRGVTPVVRLRVVK